MAILLLIIYSILLLMVIVMIVMSFFGINRITVFSDMLSDEIDFKYARTYEEYMEKTKRDIIPYKLNRKKLNLDISASYAKFKDSALWDWNFENMIVDEIDS